MAQFNFVQFSKWVGFLCLAFSIVIISNIIIMDSNFGLTKIAVEYFLYGIIILGIGKLIDLSEHHYQEIKFFRKHYIEKDKQTAKILLLEEKEG